MRKQGRFFTQGPAPSQGLHPLYGSGNGFVPDVMSESGFQTLPEVCGTKLEVEDPIFAGQFEFPNINPPFGLDGMMPLPFAEQFQPVQPGLREDEEGVGGAGSFLTSAAIGAKG